MRYANNYKGLKKRPEYDDIVDYLNNKLPKIEYPDRLASFLRRTNQLSNLLDSDGYSLFDLEMQQQKIWLLNNKKWLLFLKWEHHHHHMHHHHYMAHHHYFYMAHHHHMYHYHHMAHHDRHHHLLCVRSMVILHQCLI